MKNLKEIKLDKNVLSHEVIISHAEELKGTRMTIQLLTRMLANAHDKLWKLIDEEFPEYIGFEKMYNYKEIMIEIEIKPKSN